MAKIVAKPNLRDLYQKAAAMELERNFHSARDLSTFVLLPRVLGFGNPDADASNKLRLLEARLMQLGPWALHVARTKTIAEHVGELVSRGNLCLDTSKAQVAWSSEVLGLGEATDRYGYYAVPTNYEGEAGWLSFVSYIVKENKDGVEQPAMQSPQLPFLIPALFWGKLCSGTAKLTVAADMFPDRAGDKTEHRWEPAANLKTPEQIFGATGTNVVELGLLPEVLE